MILEYFFTLNPNFRVDGPGFKYFMLNLTIYDFLEEKLKS